MTSRSQVTKLIGSIPVDKLRPHAQFNAILTARINDFTAADIAALESITSDRHKAAHELTDKMMKPAFNPEYYTKLAAAMRGDQKPSSPFYFITKYFRWS